MLGCGLHPHSKYPFLLLVGRLFSAVIEYQLLFSVGFTSIDLVKVETELDLLITQRIVFS